MDNKNSSRQKFALGQKIIFGLFCLLASFWFLPSVTNAASYYVDFTNGLDTNTGTEAAPLKYHPWMSNFTGTVTLQAGDTIYMKRGEQWVKSSPTTNWLTVGASGVSGNYITTTAYGSGAQPLIKIGTNSSYSVIYGAGKSYIKFDNLHIQHAASTVDVGHGIYFEKDGSNNVPHDWIITNNEIDTVRIGIFGSGDSYNITVGDTSATQTATQSSYSNNIHDFGYGGVLLLGRNPATGRSDFNVYKNYIHDSTQLTCGTDSYGIMFSVNAGSSGWPAYATARYNRVEGIKAWEGLDTHGGSYIYYLNNYVYDTAMSIMAGSAQVAGIPDTADHYYIEDNIFENPPDQLCNSLGKSFVFLGSYSNQKNTNATIKNNKIFFTTRPGNVQRNTLSLRYVDMVEIDGNEIYNGPTAWAASAIFIEGTEVAYGNITIKNNYIHDWYLKAVTFYTNSADGPISIYNNVINATWGISVKGGDILQNVDIYNNNIQNVAAGGYLPYSVIWEDFNGIATNATVNIKNNVFNHKQAEDVFYVYAPRSNMNSRLTNNYNLYFNTTRASPFYMGVTTQNWSAWQALGYDAAGLGPSANPLLTNTTGNYSAVTDFVPLWNSPLIDSGTDVSLTTDRAGNPIYGTADIGPYEYQPPYTMGADNVDSSSTIRVYANGKYRNTNTPSGTTVGLVVTPTGGFGAGTYTAWMDIKINTWNTTSTMYRRWTESNTSANNTIHTIKNLTANKYYTVWYTKDGGTQTRLTAAQTNASGEATFTYNQGYSTVVFEMIEDVTQPASFSTAFPQNGNSTASTRPSLSWNASSDSESGLAKYQLYIDNALDTDNISNTATSVATTASLSCASHSWYVKALDYAGNATTTPSTSFTVTCATGGGTSGSTGAGGWSTPPPPVVTPTSTLASVTSTPTLATSTPALATSTLAMATSTPSLSPSATSTVVDKAAAPSLAKKIIAPVTVSRISSPLIQQIPANFKFIFNLGYGRRGQAVRYLQMFLAAQPEEFYPKDKLSYWFGPMTYRAVVRFQEKYKTETLTPFKLKKGTGFAGVKTREVMNKMLGN